MIAQIMTYCKNHFDRSREAQAFGIVSDGITGSFGEKYIVGQYIWVVDSFVNDGVYKITEVTANKLTLDATLTPENTGELIIVYGLAVPTDFLALVSDIDSWVANNSGKEGINSETIDSYSISFGNGANGAVGNSWQGAFAGRLQPYRQVFETPTSNYTTNSR